MMNKEGLLAAIVIVLSLAVLSTLGLLVMITMQTSTSGLEAMAVLSLMLFATPLLFAGFLVIKRDIRVPEIYQSRWSGAAAVIFFGIAATIGATLRSEWLALLYSVAG